MKRKILIIAIGIALGTTSFLVAATWQHACDYVTLLIVEEQRDHYVRMHEHVVRLQHKVRYMEGDVMLIQNEKLTSEQKQQIQEDLRDIEEIGAQISRRMIYYDEDNTVHMFFAPEERVVSLFKETYNTPLYINRFVRVAEQGLFATSLTKDQKSVIGELFRELQQETERLNSIVLQ